MSYSSHTSAFGLGVFRRGTSMLFANPTAPMGWKVEGHGVDPDIEIEMPPEAYLRGDDPQLDRAIDEGLAMLEKDPVAEPDLGPSPVRSRLG